MHGQRNEGGRACGQRSLPTPVRDAGGRGAEPRPLRVLLATGVGPTRQGAQDLKRRPTRDDWELDLIAPSSFTQYVLRRNTREWVRPMNRLSRRTLCRETESSPQKIHFSVRTQIPPTPCGRLPHRYRSPITPPVRTHPQNRVLSIAGPASSNRFFCSRFAAAISAFRASLSACRFAASSARIASPS